MKNKPAFLFENNLKSKELSIPFHKQNKTKKDELCEELNIILEDMENENFEEDVNNEINENLENEENAKVKDMKVEDMKVKDMKDNDLKNEDIKGNHMKVGDKIPSDGEDSIINTGIGETSLLPDFDTFISKSIFLPKKNELIKDNNFNEICKSTIQSEKSRENISLISENNFNKICTREVQRDNLRENNLFLNENNFSKICKRERQFNLESENMLIKEQSNRENQCLDFLEDFMVNLPCRVKKLREYWRYLENEIKIYKKKYIDLEKSYNSTKFLCENKTKENYNLQSNIKMLENETHKLKDENYKFTTEVGVLRNASDQMKNDFKMLENLNFNLNEQIKNANYKNKVLLINKFLAKKIITDSFFLNEIISSKLTNSMNENKILELKLKNINNKLDTEKNHVDCLLDTIRNLDDEVLEYKKKYFNDFFIFNTEIQEKNIKFSELKNNSDKDTSKIFELTNLNKKFEAKINNSKETTKVLEKSLLDLKNEKNTLENELNVLKINEDKHNTHRKDLTTEIDKLKAIIEENESKIKYLEKENEKNILEKSKSTKIIQTKTFNENVLLKNKLHGIENLFHKEKRKNIFLVNLIQKIQTETQSLENEVNFIIDNVFENTKIFKLEFNNLIKSHKNEMEKTKSNSERKIKALNLELRKYKKNLKSKKVKPSVEEPLDSDLWSVFNEE
ncbi:hypothetical protein CWI37_0595p0010 [Hamiltosporidium tvaerminnensis]|uniref:Uncharacterized protein n=1 Tax=Hamiltosporidium tvaerminnensis TaxID=1176355 RepID=A0A4Q9L3B7_9MICR|nr:hypothetical protein CWI37_0595p0010 [Hamiltosporidium tvaerminnensis]